MIQIGDVRDYAFRYRSSLDLMRRLEFDSFGVRFALEAEHEVWLDNIRSRLSLVFGDLISFRDQINSSVSIRLSSNTEGSVTVIDSVEEIEKRYSPEYLAEAVESLVRIRVGDLAEKHVFVHAGAVAIGGKALVLPGRSRSGKSTLVAELLRMGAQYLSDEYAVVDEEGLVHAFPKPLSLRIEGEANTQRDVPAETLGAESILSPIACGMILVTEYKAGSRFAPEGLSRAEGMMEILRHTVPVRRNTEFSLKVLNKLTLRAIIAQSYRPEADEVAIQLINYFNREVISTS